ncbi:hypothetical protein Ahy_A02g007597 [Arachis hypogaea]|uniref:Uncharacterized protein n=1 Tax=Arachis hypogaea TaxID=3818 RepID=A0A445ECM0_ARAHY|nr:hypothetical protein Ahy_A02g007597 [Arachis hypogaea]
MNRALIVSEKSLCILHSLRQSLLVDTAMTQHGIGDEATLKKIIYEVDTDNVLKFLMERNSVNVLHGQVTSGTLILQDCAVSLLFALLPVLGGTSGVLQGVTYMTKSYLFGDSLRL